MTNDAGQTEQDLEFLGYMRRAAAMYRLTKNNVLNTYWEHVREVVENGFLAFILRGAVSWDSESEEKIEAADGSLWLKSDLYNPVGKHIAAEPVRRYLQWQMNISDIWGGLTVSVNPENEEEARANLERGVVDIALLSNLLSFLTGVSSTWYPARYLKLKVIPASSPPREEERSEWRCLPLSRHQEEHSGVSVKDSFVRGQLLPLFTLFKRLDYPEISAVLGRSLSWHAQGNYLASGLNRFVNYWQSIELLGHFFYKRLPQANKRGEESSRSRATIRQKMRTVLPILTEEDDLDEQLFGRHLGGVSLYDLRNDIAHGNRCDHEVDFTDLVDGRLNEIRQLGKSILRSTLGRADNLGNLLYGTHGT